MARASGACAALSVEEPRALAGSEESRQRRSAAAWEAALLAVLALDLSLGPTVLLGAFGFDAAACLSAQVGAWSVGTSVADLVALAALRDILGVALLLACRGAAHPTAARWVRRACASAALAAACRTACLDGPAARDFLGILVVEAATCVASVAASQLLVARLQDAGRAAEEPDAQPRGGIGPMLGLLKPYVWPSTGNWYDVARNRLRAVSTWVLVALSKAFSVAAPMYFAQATHHVAEALQSGDDGYPTFHRVAGDLVLYAFLSFASKQIKELQQAMFLQVRQAAYVETSDRTFAHLHSLSLDWHLRKRMGGLVRTLDRGIQAAEQTVEHVGLWLLPTFAEAVAVVALFAFKFRHPDIAAIFALSLVVYVYATIKVTLWRKRFRSGTAAHDSASHDLLSDSLTNYEAIKCFTTEDYERSEYSKAVRKFQKYSVASQASQSVLYVGQWVTVHATLLAGMLLATRRVLARSGDVGELVLVVAYVFTIFGPLAFLGSLYHMVVNATVDLRALGEILATEPSVRDKLGARDLDVAEKPGVPMIEFVGVGFAYGCQGAQVSLQDISFSVPHGGSVALVGPSGAGKTTLTRLLFRFYDADQGSVRLNGQDVGSVTQRSLRAAVGFVPQDVVLFNASIGHNIGYGRLGLGDAGASREEVERAARGAQLESFVAQQAGGYDAVVGERGLRLSGGERQRVAIARCLLKDPQVVVLDEATCALDSAMEGRVQRALEALSASRTVLAIAHRLSTIRRFDEILVLDGGRIVERGSHDSLMAEGMRYRQMWRCQSEGLCAA